MGSGRRSRWTPLVGVLCAVLVLAGCSVGGASGAGNGGASGAGTGQGAAAGTSSAQQGAPSADWVRQENAKPGDAGWRITSAQVAGDLQLAGYADHASITPGQPVRLYVTATERGYTVRAFRLGWYGGKQARLVWTSRQVAGQRQPAARLGAGRMVTTTWAPSLTVPTTGWPEGTYLLLLTGADGKKKYIPLTVRSRVLAHRLVLVNAVTTYQAYNAWGGYSLYHGPGRSFATRAHLVSFDRPYDANGARIVTNYEQGAIAQAERSGLPLAYLASTDLAAQTPQLRAAAGIVSLGHDEYWTTGMRAAVTAARDAGTNLAFLGANAVYWRVRLQASSLGPDRVIAGYKSAAADPVNGPTTTVKWRSAPDPRPENSLVGMLYECFPAQGPMVVIDPGSFLFAGTGARRGSSFPGLVGTEIDRAYPIAGTPPGLQVLAHSPVRCGPDKRTFSDVTYYTSASGAGVFAVGTMLWTKALRGADPAFGIDERSVAFSRKVTANLLQAMAAGPMGRAHPAQPNLAQLHESSSTSTGTGGTVGS